MKNRSNEFEYGLDTYNSTRLRSPPKPIRSLARSCVKVVPFHLYVCALFVIKRARFDIHSIVHLEKTFVLKILSLDI